MLTQLLASWIMEPPSPSESYFKNHASLRQKTASSALRCQPYYQYFRRAAEAVADEHAAAALVAERETMAEREASFFSNERFSICLLAFVRCSLCVQ